LHIYSGIARIIPQYGNEKKDAVWKRVRVDVMCVVQMSHVKLT
jgi:hypothetical protein